MLVSACDVSPAPDILLSLSFHPSHGQWTLWTVRADAERLKETLRLQLPWAQPSLYCSTLWTFSREIKCIWYLLTTELSKVKSSHARLSCCQNSKYESCIAYYAAEHILDTISITIAAPDCTCLNLDSKAANPAMHATPVHTILTSQPQHPTVRTLMALTAFVWLHSAADSGLVKILGVVGYLIYCLKI